MSSTESYSFQLVQRLRFKMNPIKYLTGISLGLVILSGCTNGNPVIKSLGIFDAKLEPIEITIPVGSTIQVAQFNQSFKLIGICPKTIEGFEYSMDAKTFSRAKSEDVIVNSRCNTDGHFELQINNLRTLTQSLAVPNPTIQSADALAISIRGFAKNGQTEKRTITFTTVAGSSPIATGTQLGITSNIESSLGLINGSFNPNLGVQLNWTSSLSASPEVFAEISSDGGGTWIPIAKGENNGKLTISPEIAKDYLLNGTSLRLSEQSGGKKVIAITPTLKTITSNPAMPSALDLSTPSTNPNTFTSISLSVTSLAKSDETVAIYKESDCKTLLAAKASSGSGLDTLKINGLSADGNYGYYAQVIDGAGNRSPCSSANLVYGLDRTLPIVTGLTDDYNPTNSKTWTWACTDANSPCTYRYVIRTTTTTTPFSGDSAAFSNTTTATQAGGETIYYLYVQAKDKAGNLSNTIQVQAELNSSAPGIAFSSPSKTVVKSSTSFYYDITYSNIKTGSITLAASDVTFNYTGTSNSCTISSIDTTGSTTRRVNITGCSGNGTVAIKIGAGTAKSPSNVSAGASGFSGTTTIDNTIPSFTIGSASKTAANASTNVTFSISLSEAATVNLTTSHILFSGTATAGCTAVVTNGTTSTPTVQISGCNGNGTVQFLIESGAATDAAGNTSLASSNSATINIDNTAPTLSIGSASPTAGNSSTSFVYTVAYSGATTIALTPALISFSGTATSGCSALVSGSGTTSRTVTISGCTGNGTMAFSILGASATDAANNSAGASSSSTNAIVDNTPPNLSWGAITPTAGTSTTTFIFNLSYSDYTTVNLLNFHVSAVTSGSVSGCTSPSISGGGTGVPSISISGCTGEGTLKLQISSGSAMDLVGNLAPALGLSSAVTIDNTGPAISLSAPSVSSANTSTNIVYTATVSNAASFNLLASDILFSGAGSTDCAASISGLSLTSATITVTGCSGNGAMHINIKAGVAKDSLNNSSAATPISSQVTIDNEGPSVALSSGSPASGSSSAHFQFTASVTGSVSVTLTNADVSLQGATAGCAVTITNGNTTTPTLSISGCSGDGSLQIRINAGIALDALSNPSTASSWSTSVTVINTALSIGYDTGYTRLEYKDGSGVSYWNSSLNLFAADLGSSVSIYGYKALSLIDHYEVAVGSSTGANNISPWTTAGTSFSASLNLASALPGHEYYAGIKALDSQGGSSSVLSNTPLFIKYASDGSLSEPATSKSGSTIKVSSDGLRMMIGDPVAEKVLIYQRNSGSRSHWTLRTTLTASADGVTSASNDSSYGHSLAILKVAAEKYLYLIGAPRARSTTSGGATYGGRVISHFETGGSVGAKLQWVRAKDINNESYENYDDDNFGKSMTLWNDGTTDYLLIGAPGMDCMSISGNNCGSTVTDGGAIYAMSISCPSSTCSATSLTGVQKYTEATPGVNNKYGEILQASASTYIVGTGAAGSGSLYAHTALGNSVSSIASGLTITSQGQVDICESEVTKGRPLVAYLDATGGVHLGKYIGSSFVWKTGLDSGWTSVALYSDTNLAVSDHQGISIALGDASASARAVVGLVDWNQTSGYSVKQDLAPFATGMSSSDQFGKAIVIFDSYISVGAPNSNKTYNFY